MPSLQYEAGYEAGYRDGIGIVTPWAQILIALGGLRDQMPVDEVIAVQRFAERLKDRRSDSGRHAERGDVQLAPSEGCQSGGKAASPNPSRPSQDTSPSSKPSEEQP